MTTANDIDVLTAPELEAMLAGAPWRSLAVLGDGDLSWVDLVVAPLDAAGPGLEVLHLGRRDRSAREVREEQLDRALAFRPDLAIVVAGGNDVLHESFDPAAVRAELDTIVRRLRRGGAEVVMVERPGERMRPLAAITRSVAAQHGAILVAMRGHPASADPGVYATETVRCLAAALEMRVAA